MEGGFFIVDQMGTISSSYILTVLIKIFAAMMK